MTKDLNYYMGLSYTYIVKIYKDGAVFVKVKELEGCMTEGDSLINGFTMIRDAMCGWFLACIEDGIKIPEPEEM